MAVDASVLDEAIAGLDALELAGDGAPGRVSRFWSAAWPKLAAIVIAVLAWQVVVWLHLKESYALPGPATVGRQLLHVNDDGLFLEAVARTMRRAVVGYAVALVGGTLLGLAVARVRLLRAAVGSLITGLQTMPSIAWFPLAILLFRLSETAILSVVVLGAAPAIANGVISGVDHVPPLLLRAGRSLGARRLALYRHVIIPASLPAFIGGLKQGWAFAWRSLMAGELLVIIASRPSIGVQLQVAREFADAEGLLASMIVILVIGIAIDAALFGTVERSLRRRWGLLETRA